MVISSGATTSRRTPCIHLCLSLFPRTGGSTPSRSEKLSVTRRAEKARSMQDRTDGRVLGGPRMTNSFTHFLEMEIFDAGLRKQT